MRPPPTETQRTGRPEALFAAGLTAVSGDCGGLAACRRYPFALTHHGANGLGQVTTCRVPLAANGLGLATTRRAPLAALAYPLAPDAGAAVAPGRPERKSP